MTLIGPLPSSNGRNNRQDLITLRNALAKKWDIPESTIEHAKAWLSQKIDPADDCDDEMRGKVTRLIQEAIKSDLKAEELDFKMREAERDRNPETPKTKRIVLERVSKDE